MFKKNITTNSLCEPFGVDLSFLVSSSLGKLWAFVTVEEFNVIFSNS